MISELDLPGGDGLGLLSEARKRPWGQKLPWVIVTGRGGRTDAQKAFDLGAADFVRKPFNPDELLARIRRNIAIFAPLRQQP